MPPPQQHTAYRHQITLTDDHVVLETDWARSEAPWTSVSKVYRSGKYWMFLVGMEPWCAPRRYFANAVEEHEFLSAVVARLSDAARARSPQAVAFARKAAGQATA